MKKPPPIPAWTMPHLTGAIGDVIRAAGVWGTEKATGEPSDAAYQLVTQYSLQLLTLCLQREPTPEEFGMIFEPQPPRT